MQAYLKRLSYLMDLQADGETPPTSPNSQGYLADYPEFLRSLLDGSAGSSYHLTEPTTGKLKLTAANLATFQALIHEIRAHAGEGYKVIKIHESADHSGQMVDMVLLQLI